MAATAIQTLPQTPITVLKADANAELPSFELATIKPTGATGLGLVGFNSYPGNRVVVGTAYVSRVMHYAFDIQPYQLSGGPAWVYTDPYDIIVLPPAPSEPEAIQQRSIRWDPTDQQRKMLQDVLAQRFGLKFHRSEMNRSVYILTRNSKTLQLADAKDKDRSPNAAFFTRGNISDGEAAGLNVSMLYLVKVLAEDLDEPVVDRTGLQGSYDFHIAPYDKTNTDHPAAIMESLKRIGLELKKGKAPIKTIVIDAITRPTEN